MPDTLTDARVLVAVPDGAEGARAVSELGEELGVEPVPKRGAMATEYLRDLAPTVDCIVCLSDRAEWVKDLSEAAPSVPLIVYGDHTPPAPVDGIVASDGGMGTLSKRVADQIRRSRERDRLAEANAKLTALGAYSREITACESVEEVVDNVVDAVTEALAYGECVLALAEGGMFVPYGDTLPYEPEITLTVAEGVAGRTYQTQESQLVDKYRTDPDRNRRVPNVGSVASIPIGDHGVLQVTTERTDAFDERDLEFLEIVGSHAREALSRLRRESVLRVERDRLHAFFEGLPAPTVYVEAEAGDPPVLADANAAYDAAFPDAPVGEPVETAFPTECERRLYCESIRSEGCRSVTVRRETAAGGTESMTLAFFPVQTPGIEAAGFGVYVSDVSLP
ncbi:GAF domain-containing protein [Halorarum salinum]|uniref:GAF domain-containing protein n=1 Tax=Halorarum salinum TaxID=2743089 RepID=A0A7D5QJ30_9EURY|nr:GAF domain-containing protein [Halobaculum salinum]QLG63444.1 GAF domain-containing protein [Halobaculum salinum]